MERSLNIKDANYRNLRRAVANFRALDAKKKTQVLDKLNQHLKAKLPNTDIQRKFKEINA